MLTIKLRVTVLLLTLVQAKSILKKQKIYLPYLLPFAPLVLSPVVRAEPAVLGVVRSQENATQWAEITSRLQAAGVNYCAIDLPSVSSAADWSDRPVIFLPNIETLTPAQAIALEAWMSRGGRVITSGPVGNASQPGVRQLLRSLLGAYWGFDLSSPSNLRPLKTGTQEWVGQVGLDGTAQGGVIIPTGINSKPAATWQSPDSSPAVVTTDSATVLGWRWGANPVVPVELDSAWLRAALSRYITLPNPAIAPDEVAAAPKNCNGTATAAIPSQPQPAPPNVHPTTASPVPTPATNPTTAAVPPPRLIPSAKQPPSEDPLERISPPSLEESFTSVQAVALKQELENLIGRFQSAQLAASARGGERQVADKGVEMNTAALSPQSTELSPEQVVAEAREIAKTLPQLIDRKDFATARQQWQKAQQLLWKHYPVNRSMAQPEIRAIWLDRGTIVTAGSEQGLAKIFDRLAAAGINTVFFETVNAGYPIYPSQVAPQHNPLVRNWDPLAAAVKLAHEREIELHAWVWAFAVGNHRHNRLIDLPDDYPGPVITAHPDWASYDNRGSLFPPGQGKPFLDPANRAARQYLLQLFEEIVSRYQVDGIQLDYIRYPFQDPGADRTYGYGIAARQQFQQMTGVDPLQIRTSDRQLWQQWTEFRTRQVDSFVGEVSQRLRQKRPNLIVSVAVFPLSEHERMHKLQQHWEVWANRGDVDLIVPMTYAKDTYRFQRLAKPWITSNKIGSALILPGIRLLNLPVSEAIDQIQLARDLPVSGYSLFAAENLNGELQQIFNQTQKSDNTSPEPVPYRQPFQTVAARYAALQQEWNFLLTNNQLWLRGSVLSTFNSQAKELENVLNQLAAEPSAERLAAARRVLSSFQSQFPQWMRSQAWENSYQVNVWSNRLATLERLLNYGDRAVLQRKSPPVAEQWRGLWILR